MQATARNCASGWRGINAQVLPVYTVVHGDIDLSQLLNTSGFMLKRTCWQANRVSTFIADKQNDVSSIVVELITRWISARFPRGDENLLLESADKLLRCQRCAVDDGELNRLLFRGVQRASTAPDWDRPWATKTPHSALVFIGDPAAGRRDKSGVCGLRK